MIVGQLADVHQTLFAGQDFNKSSEVGYPGHSTGVCPAYLNIPGQLLNYFDGLLGCLLAR